MGERGKAVYKENGTGSNRIPCCGENCQTVAFPVSPAGLVPQPDSLGYIPVYKLEDAHLYRTTLRYPEPGLGLLWWNLGPTDTEDHDNIIDYETYRDWLERKLISWRGNGPGWIHRIVCPKRSKEITELFEYLGLQSGDKLPKSAQCSADIQQVAKQSFAMQPGDKDMIVMLHEIDYTKNGHLEKKAPRW